MASRPKVHRSELGRAIAMIARRREKVDDRNREMLPDAPDSDPREVLDYLRRYSGPNIPRWVLQADVCDALTLNNWLWWEDRRRELHFLKAGRDRGLFLAQLGAQVGVGKQGVLDRIDRLEALLRYDRPDEKITRCERRSQHHRRQHWPTHATWLHSHREELISIFNALVSAADGYQIDDEQREWVDELALDARDDELTPATMVILSLATVELRSAPAVLALNSTRPHAIHTLLARADALRSEFSELGNAGVRLRGDERTSRDVRLSRTAPPHPDNPAPSDSTSPSPAGHPRNHAARELGFRRFM